MLLNEKSGQSSDMELPFVGDVIFSYDVTSRRFYNFGDKPGKLQITARHHESLSPKPLQLSVTLRDPILNEFFSEEERSFQGILEHGGHKKIIQLSTHGIDSEKFLSLHQQEFNREKVRLEQRLPEFLEMNQHLKERFGYSDEALEKTCKEYQQEEINNFMNDWFYNSHKPNDSADFYDYDAVLFDEECVHREPWFRICPDSDIAVLDLYVDFFEEDGTVFKARSFAETNRGHRQKLYFRRQGFVIYEEWLKF